ncbi:SDR family NAD(P)-dependent oxidoreductase [Thalassolituus sp. LLYu03]|uniref:SDR family NAD(P)-dependent oxidoreductase n=1 Tax=Thalassolituus sp. LLYu03 TaxID=3421656 RepID=UPI003D2B633D
MQTKPIAVITGGSRGLGANTVLALAKRGIDSVLTWNSNEQAAQAVCAEAAALGATVVALPLDTGDTRQFMPFRQRLQATLEQHWARSTFDYLVNNAGFGHNAPFAAQTEEAFDELYRVHLKGPYFLAQTLLPLISDGGSIVNLSSGLARFSLPGYSAYAAMKGAMEVISRYQAKELGQRGIRVNTLAPGAIATDFGGGAVRDNPQVNTMVASATALGRAGIADDIGPAIAALLSDDCHWVNGQRIEVSGGMFL